MKQDSPLRKTFQDIDYKGVEKIVQMIKQTLKETPRLRKDFFSLDVKVHERAKAEILWVFKTIDEAVFMLSEETKTSLEDLWKEIGNPKYYTPEEVTLLKDSLQVRKTHSSLLEKPSTKPPKKSKRLRFRA